MNVAYILTAYNNPKQLHKLIQSLNCLEDYMKTDFYIHIDRKVPIEPFTDLIHMANVFWVDRVHINWAGYSMVESELNCIKAIIDSPTDYDRVLYLTSQDYPIRSNRELFDQWTANPDKEYIMAYNMSDSPDIKWRRRITAINNYDIYFKNSRLTHDIRAIKREFFFFLHDLGLYKKKPFLINEDGSTYKFWYGNALWCLTYKCIELIYKEMTSNKALVEYLKTSFSASEIFAQTIIWNSDFREHTVGESDIHKLKYLSALHELDYQPDGFVIYGEEDFDMLRRTDKLFFRKVIDGQTDQLVAKIDEFRMAN